MRCPGRAAPRVSRGARRRSGSRPGSVARLRSSTPSLPRAASGRGPCAYALLEARLDEVVEVPVEDRLGVAFLDAGAQVLDARLVEHVRADLVPPPDVGLRVLQRLLRLGALAQFLLVELRLQHR